MNTIDTPHDKKHTEKGVEKAEEMKNSKTDRRCLLNEVGLSAVKSLTCKSANSRAAMLPQLSSDSLSRKKKNDIKYNTNSTVLKFLKKPNYC